MLRLAHLGRASLWQDEIVFTATAGATASARELLIASWSMILNIGQLPAAFLVWHLYFKLFAINLEMLIAHPFLARIPAVLFGVLSVYFTHRFSMSFLSKPVAWIATLFAATLFFPVYYSREAYCYPFILFLSSFSLYHIRQIIFGKVSCWRHYIAATVGLSVLSYSHLGCLFLLTSLGIVLFVGFIRQVISSGWNRHSSRLFIAGSGVGIALLTILPYVLHFALHNTAHQVGSSHTSFVILNDVIAKMFMGDRPAYALTAWILFLCGLGVLCRQDINQAENRFWVSVLLLGLFSLVWGTQRTQYISVRYFTVLFPLIVIVYARGFHYITQTLADLIPFAKARFIQSVSTAFIIITTFSCYLLPMYALKAKEPVDWKLAATWLNSNLPDGTPYMWMSAHVLRWVPGFYQTPERLAVAPYLFGHEPGETRRNVERQRDFSRRFPVSAYIGAVGHHPGEYTEGNWPPAYRAYRQHTVVGEPGLAPLTRRGIYIWDPKRQLMRDDWAIDIFYNSREDAVWMARQRGDRVYFDLQGWRCEPIMQDPQGHWTDYGHVHHGTRATINLINLKDETLQGKVRLELAIIGQSPTPYPVSITLLDTICQNMDIAPNQLLVIDSSTVTLPTDDNAHMTIDVPANGTPSPQALVIYDITFIDD
jgi:hypothetical protein